MNTFVRAPLRYEGVQLHLGLRVVNFFLDVLLGHPFLQSTIPLSIGLREACAYANGIVLIL